MTSAAINGGHPLPWHFLPMKWLGMLATFLTGLDAQATRFVERREEQRARAESRAVG